MAHIEVTVHYPNGRLAFFDVESTTTRLIRLGEVYGKSTGVYEDSGYDCNECGHFIIAEVSEDKKDVWVDFVEY